MNLINTKIKTEIDIDEKEQIQKLLIDEFRITTLPDIDNYCLCYLGTKIIGFAATTDRTVIIDNNELKLNLFGMFLIVEQYRNRGVGSEFIQKIVELINKKNNMGVILNCGHSLERFYLKNGFIKICDSAIYLRNNERVTDNDPVYYMGKNIYKECKMVFFGTDF